MKVTTANNDGSHTTIEKFPNGVWLKYTIDKRDDLVSFENSRGHKLTQRFDSEGVLIDMQVEGM